MTEIEYFGSKWIRLPNGHCYKLEGVVALAPVIDECTGANPPFRGYRIMLGWSSVLEIELWGLKAPLDDKEANAKALAKQQEIVAFLLNIVAPPPEQRYRVSYAVGSVAPVSAPVKCHADGRLELRIDCDKDPSFWLELELEPIPKEIP